MTNDGKKRDRFVADVVDDQTEKDDADRKRPHASAIDRAFLLLREIKAVLQLTDRIGPHTKDEGSGDKGDEAGPKQFHVGL